MRFITGRLLLPLLLLCFNCLAAENGKSDPSSHDGTKETRSLVEAKGKGPSDYLERSLDDSKAITPLAEFPCPVASVIEPCVCSNDTDGIRLYLDCTLVESEVQLAAVFQQEFPVKEFYQFSMSNNSAVKMLNNITNGITFESLYLYPGPFNLEAISEYFLLVSKDTVKAIQIQNSKLITEMFPFLVLPLMNQLSTLGFIGSDMNGIPPIRATNLSYFDVSSSPVERLVNGTISVGTGMMTIHFNYNNISTIEPGSIFFADEESAASGESLYINLVGNRLQSLQAGTFQLRNGFYQLLINENQIVSIEPGTFVLPNASGNGSYGDLVIDLAPNQLQSLQAGTFPLRNGLVALHLHSNNISSIEPGTFVLSEAAGDAGYKFIYIDLAPNQLQSLQAGTFPLRNGEVAIFLYSNSISSIEPGTFVLPEATDSMILHLNLGSNELTTIDEAVFGDLMPFIAYLGMYENPLTCGCDIAWLILNTGFIAVVDSSASCANGTLLQDLNPQDFVDSCLV